MNKDQEYSHGLGLIQTAWDYFWKHCPDCAAQSGYDYGDDVYESARDAAQEILESL